jgi:hypothetical protein
MSRGSDTSDSTLPGFESRDATRVLLALLALYAIAFVVFYPPTVTIADEGNYVRQAQLLIRGEGRAIDVVDPFTGETIEIEPINDYPLGTALLLVPFVAAGGRDAAHWLALVCTLIGVGVTARWLHDMRYSPLWAALVLGYPATAIMGRVAMSDAPSLMVVALGLWLIWRGTSGSRLSLLALFAGGILAGFSFALREANALAFAPFLCGVLLRSVAGWPLIIVGGALGISVRIVSAWLFFGDPFFTKDPDPFSLDVMLVTAPVYLVCLLVLVPGGLVSAFLYRGPLRAEVRSTIAIFVLFHLLYGYSAVESGFAKRLILGPRYFIPILPLFAVAAAEVWPRLARDLMARSSPDRRQRLVRATRHAMRGALVAVSLGLVAVHFVHWDWAADQAIIRDAIYETTEEGSVVVANTKAIGKFVDHVYGRRLVLDRSQLETPHLRRLVARQGGFFIVMLDRSDSAFWRKNTAENSDFMARLPFDTQLLVDLQVTPTDHLRIWRVGR